MHCKIIRAANSSLISNGFSVISVLNIKDFSIGSRFKFWGHLVLMIAIIIAFDIGRTLPKTDLS